ncbi:MAG: phage tail protein [Roseiarcus sp.]
MGFLRDSNQKPDYTDLQLTTSTWTLPIPIVWGMNKIAGNVIAYQNFKIKSSGGGKGGLFGAGGATGYTADVIIGICEGPIGSIGQIWRGGQIYNVEQLYLTEYTGTAMQTTWPYWEATYPNEALAYQSTAYVCDANFGLDASAGIGQISFEVLGVDAGGGANAGDADPAFTIFDFLTNPQYGAGFNPASINLTTLYGGGAGSTDASLQAYCWALGIAISPALVSPEPASSALTRWLQITNCGAVWSGGQLKFIPFGDVAVATGNTPVVIKMAVPQPTVTGATVPLVVYLVPSDQFVSDGGVVYTFTGTALAYTGSAPTGVGTYGISPTGTYIFDYQDAGAAVTISFTRAVLRGYAPDMTPAYSLTDLDFVDEKGNKDPITVSRLDPFSLPNIVRINCLSRLNQYGGTIVEARDQSQIELYGPRINSAISAREIPDDLTVAPIVAQTILQRGLYIRQHFTFKLSWEYCLLDPMDIVEITDANLGLVNALVRIITIEEDDNGTLTVTAEELTIGVSTPANNPGQGGGGGTPPSSGAPPAINPPLIYEPPPALSNNSLVLWIGASPQGGGGLGPSWGGARIYISFDGTTYTHLTNVSNSIGQGVLTASLPAETGWDDSHTLSVDMSESGATLVGTSGPGAKSGATLSLIDSELLGYVYATLTSGDKYNLLALPRGLDGTTGAAHAIGAQFFSLVSGLLSYSYPPAYIGVQLYFKFQSWNWAGELEDLSTCAVYTYTPTGAGMIGPVTEALLLGTSMDWGAVAGDPVALSDDWGTASSPTTVIVDLGNVV